MSSGPLEIMVKEELISGSPQGCILSPSDYEEQTDDEEDLMDDMKNEFKSRRHENSPCELFELFFSDDIISRMTSGCNSRCNTSKAAHIQPEEMRVFLGILLISGYNRLPRRSLYWSTGEDVTNISIVNSMRRDRFEHIMRTLTFSPKESGEEESDRYSNIRPLLSHIQAKCALHFLPSDNYLSMDEIMVQTCGKQNLKRPVHNVAPMRLTCLNSPCGYLVNFEPCQGKNDDDKSRALQLIEGLNGSSHIMLSSGLTSIPLLNELKRRGIEGTGYIKSSSHCSSEKTVHITTPQSSSPSSSLLVASTSTTKDPNDECTQRASSGLERMNQGMNGYRIGIRGKKWWWPLFTWLVDLSIWNAWQIHRSSSSPSKDLLEFRREVASSYVKKYGHKSKTWGKRKHSNPGESENRYDGYNHFVRRVADGKRRRCQAKDCSSIIRTECGKCDVGLCIPCYEGFHLKTSQ